MTTEQTQSLKLLAVREGKSIAELIRMNLDEMLCSDGVRDPGKQKQKAIAAAGKLHGGPQDLAAEHDRYLVEAFEHIH